VFWELSGLDEPFLPRGEPAALGLRAPALEALVHEAERSQSDALLVIRRGRIAVERYFRGDAGPLELMSVTKSVVALGIGFLVGEGRIRSIDQPLSTWFPEWVEGPRAAVTLRHVLTHTSGLEHGASAAAMCAHADRLEYARQRPLVEEPGRRFDYSNEATQLLAGVVRASAGQPLDSYLRDRLFTPVGIRDWRWEKDPAGNVQAFAGLALTARDLARIGLLMLAEGAWGDTVVLSPTWISHCTSPALPASAPFYGLLWYLRGAGAPDPRLRSFYADGWLGQRLVVYPGQALVAVRLHRARGGEGDAENRECGFDAFQGLLEACLD
jgi:CubicO group peptidase (beta-lactamase class C family)